VDSRPSELDPYPRTERDLSSVALWDRSCRRSRDRRRRKAAARRNAPRQKGATLADAFQGPHLAGKIYQRGQIVQRNRRTWLALVETRERPGDSSDWREFSVGPERAG